MKKLFSVIFFSFVLSSCLSTSRIAQTGPSVEIPFYRQSDYQCGPAALASVINYWYRKAGLPEISIQEIIDSIYSQGARGVLGIDLEIYARKKGFDTIQKSGTVEELKAFINEGIPPLILVSYGFSVYQLDHFMVVKGYNEKGIIVNSKKPDQFISYKELSRIWKRAGYWMLVIKP